MRKIIFTQVMTDNGKSTFSGLYDKGGLPVIVEIEKNDVGVALTAMRRNLSEFEKEKLCCKYEDCESCPLCDDCGGEYMDCEEECADCEEYMEALCDENTGC